MQERCAMQERSSRVLVDKRPRAIARVERVYFSAPRAGNKRKAYIQEVLE
jgi:hypothetical protein